MWIDSHCHLPWDDTSPSVIDRAIEADVEQMICVGTNAATSLGAINVARANPDLVRATVGLHPHEAEQGLSSVIALLDEQITIQDGAIVGIGECGLDYFYNYASRDIQKDIFAQQIHLAKQYGLALVIHTRDAWKDTFEILRSEGVPARTVVHCFTGGVAEAKTCLELGLYLSFSGIVTFPRSTTVQDAARYCIADRMTIETDSPYLTPVPFRGKPNEPAYVAQIGRFLSHMKKIEVDAFAQQVTAATQRLFNLH